jgi:hypothetical protein
MLDITKFTKVLALAGSDMDGEALAALRKAQSMLKAANLSFTDVAQSIGGSVGGQGGERLRLRIAELEGQNDIYRTMIAGYERDLNRLRRAQPNTTRAESLKRTRAQIAAKMRSVLGDAKLSLLSDREIARQTGISPQAVGNWRRRLEAERAAKRRTVHNGRRRAA